MRKVIDEEVAQAMHGKAQTVGTEREDSIFTDNKKVTALQAYGSSSDHELAIASAHKLSS